MAKENCESCQHRLQKKSLFSCLPGSCFEELEQHRSTRLFAQGKILFSPDDKPFGVYCLRRGLVKLEASCSQGKSQLLRLARPGEPLGYRSFLNSKTQKYRATALTDLRVCFFPQAYLVRILSEVPEFAQSLLKRLSDDLEFAEERWLGLMQKDAKQRVADLLLEFHELDQWPSRKDIALLADITPETLSRVLRDFERQAWLSRTRTKLKLLQPASIRSLAEGG